MNPTIVIPAYNRPVSLNRLLRSIAISTFHSPVRLIISIDGPGNPQVIECAHSFEWEHGDKKVIVREQRLGLKDHILACGDLVEQYENILLLEDDLFVSPDFYTYALQALEYFGNDEKLAGISLYQYSISEFSNQPFTVLEDGFDNYFMQLPSSWGQVFTRNQWKGFRQWLSSADVSETPKTIPLPVTQWGEHSWKKHFIRYLIEKDLFFVYPRISLTTNFEDRGTNSDASGKFQVPLGRIKNNCHFSSFSESNAKYDAWYEILPESLNRLTNTLLAYEYEIDLHASKHVFTKPYVLTRRHAHSSECSFSDAMKPGIRNVIEQLPGNGFRLARASEVDLTLPMSATSQTFQILVPVVSFDKEKWGKTARSLSVNSYPQLRVTFAVSEDLHDVFLTFLEEELRDATTNWTFYFFASKDAGACLKAALDIHHTGILAWLMPGSELSTKDLVTADKIFTDLKQIGAMFPAGMYSSPDTGRLSKEVIVQALRQGITGLNTELIFFKGDLWPRISSCLSGKPLDEHSFYSWFLFALVMQVDLHPVVSDLGSGRRSSSTPVLKLDQDVLKNSGFVISKRAADTSIYKLLRAASKTNIPVIRDFFTQYYELPLVAYCPDLKNAVYFYRK